jgi:inhibitor of cysteine peptidase
MNVVMKKVNVVIKKLKNSLILTCILSGIGCASEGMQLKLANQTSEFSFSLESNPTTGYQWALNSFDTNKLQYLGSTYQAKKPVLIGSGGMQVFKFKVLNPSANLDTKISLSYARSWEKSSVKKQVVHVFYDK